MRTRRILRVVLPLAILAIAVAAAASVLSARPDLRDAERAVERAWAPVALDLTRQYRAIDDADERLRALPGPVHDLAEELHAAVQRWNEAIGQGDVGPQVRAANTVEATRRRLVAAARVSPRVEGDPQAARAVVTLSTDTAGSRVEQFNEAVHRYERERRGPVRRLVAALLGNGHVPAFAPAPVAA
jgi:hypothetical protein